MLRAGVPVFFEPESIAQMTYGLLVCFVTFGIYSTLAPYVSDSDDRLSQLCQAQIFVVLLSAIVMRFDSTDSTERNMDVLLSVMLFGPIVFASLAEIFENFNLGAVIQTLGESKRLQRAATRVQTSFSRKRKEAEPPAQEPADGASASVDLMGAVRVLQSVDEDPENGGQSRIRKHLRR